jgi:integrase
MTWNVGLADGSEIHNSVQLAELGITLPAINRRRRSNGRRRLRGSGSIFQRKDGRWAGSVDLGFANGKRQRKVVYGKTAAEVQSKMDALTVQKSQGTLRAGKAETVETLVNDWRDWCATRPEPAGVNTLRRYEVVCRLDIVPHIGSIRLDKLTATDIDALLKLKLRTQSPSTVQQLRRVLAAALNWGIKKERLSRNPMNVAEKITVKSEEIEFLTEAEADRLIQVTAGTRTGCYWRLMVTLGLRPSEAYALRWSDIDFEKKTLHVVHNLVRPKGESWALAATKTPKSKRTIDLYPALLAELESQKASQAQDRLLAGSRWQDHGFVFASTIGSPLHLCAVRQEWYQLRKLADLPAIPMYCCRHTAATRLLAETRDIVYVAALLGHSSTAITERHYVAYAKSLSRDIGNHMAKMYG